MFGRSKKRELKAAETLAAEVKAQREVTQELVERYEQRTKKTVQAIEAASKAREERDEYRRVLAAAIASERRQELHVTGLERELKEVKESVLSEARARGAAESASGIAGARVAELEAELREAALKMEKERGDAADRAWAEREAARGEMVQLVTRGREDARALTAEVRRVLSWTGMGSRDADGNPVDDPVVNSALRQRGRVLAGVALGAVLVGVGLTPAALLAAVDAERAAYIQLASGASPWQLILCVLGSFGAAVFLYGRALRDLRSPEPRADLGAQPNSAEPTVPAPSAAKVDPPAPASAEPEPEPEPETETEPETEPGAESVAETEPEAGASGGGEDSDAVERDRLT